MINQKIISIMAIIVILVSAASYALYSRRQTESYASPQLLVDNKWLLNHLAEPKVRIIDIRNPQDYGQGHIKNAVNLELQKLWITVDGTKKVAPKEIVESILGGLGMTTDTMAVIYDEGESPDVSLVFWTLEYYGHEDARILDGGWSKWIKNGNPSTNDLSAYDKTVYKATVRPELLANADYILENLNNPRIVFLDARSEPEYKGIDVRAKRGGHIPGAVNIEWMRNFNPDGTFKSAADLLKMYEAAGVTKGKEVVTYCQTGHRAANSYFTMRLLGYTVRVYEESWQEWGNREDLPI